MKIKNLNPELKKLSIDYLYHLGLDTSLDLKKLFGDVRFVCMGGSPERAREFALCVIRGLNLDISEADVKPVGKTERFSLYKVGPVISVSHGMGMPSIAILMHEVTKLCYYAGCEDPVFIRVGTSGGIGVEPGIVVLTDEALNAGFEPFYQVIAAGKIKKYPSPLDVRLNQEIIAANPDCQIVQGKTIAADCFYEEQARTDGALDPGYTEADKLAYLTLAHEQGVRNFEMESLQFAAFCQRAGIRGADICVSLVNRLKGDQITSTHEELVGYARRAQTVAINFIKATLQE